MSVEISGEELSCGHFRPPLASFCLSFFQLGSPFIFSSPVILKGLDMYDLFYICVKTNFIDWTTSKNLGYENSFRRRRRMMMMTMMMMMILGKNLWSVFRDYPIFSSSFFLLFFFSFFFFFFFLKK